jgi:hypothetical protein
MASLTYVLFEYVHLYSAPKVPQQSNPGQRPGLRKREAIKPCKGETRLEFCTEGAATKQPRATPWVEEA